MDKCATGVCVPIASWMENKPLLIGVAVLVFALVLGGYFWWRGRSQPQVEEFVGSGGENMTNTEFVGRQGQTHEAPRTQQPEEEEQPPHEE